MPRLSPRTRALLATAVPLSLGVLAAPAPAAPAPVVSGTLGWTQHNVYNAAPVRTVLGHITNPAAGSGSAGTVAGSGGVSVTGPAGVAYPAGVGPTSPRALPADSPATIAASAYTFSYPATGGSFDPATNSGTVELSGTVTFTGYPWLAPSPPPAITVVDPQVVLDGTSGRLFASGQGNPAPTDVYTRAGGPLFTLDLSNAEAVFYADGSRGLRNIVPTLGLANVFGSAGQYVPGVSGPDRTPNSYGSFSLRVRTDPAPSLTGPRGETGAAGTNGTDGRDGAAGASVRRVLAHLRAAPYAGARSRRVVVQRHGSVLATGTLRRSTLSLTVRPGAAITAGAYNVRLWGGRQLRSIRLG